MSYAHAERQTLVYSSLAFIATETDKARELKREGTFGFMGKQIGEEFG